MSIRALLADEHSAALKELRSLIERESDIQVITGVDNRGSMLQLTRALKPDIVVVTEICVIGVTDAVKGEQPICLIVIKEGASSETFKHEITTLIQESLGPIPKPRDICVVQSLPRTRSGKYMRRVLRAIYEGQEIADLSTLEDGASLAETESAIQTMRRQWRGSRNGGEL